MRKFFSPGRVNLIGEHTDYNGGYVFPCAIDLGTYAEVTERNDRTVRLSSANFHLAVDVDLENVVYDEADGWANYPKGVIRELQQMGLSLGGLDISVSGNVPNGAGLSSSASLEVLIAVIFNDVFKLGLSMVELVKISRRAENNFVGVMCGIMDQFAVGMGKRDMAVLLNCRTLEYKYAPLALGEYSLVIANTNKRRGLLDSKYNERRTECGSALSAFQKELAIKDLCELTADMFNEYSRLVTDEVILRRAKHVISENERVKQSVSSLEQNDLLTFGQLLNKSHESLKNDYEVTGLELDVLAETAQQFDGCLGARMTGAGFGGCTVNIVKTDKIEDFRAFAGEKYGQSTNLAADFYTVKASDGAKEL
ncbi:galactokinase [Clostridia bacterium]|nr:galactokinase [Clostridia bacterium]